MPTNALLLTQPAKIPDTCAKAPDTCPKARPFHPDAVVNRVEAVMQHIPFYTFKGQARLAHDAGIAPSTVSRMLSGRSVPSYPIVLAVASALERRLGGPLDPRELVSADGRFPTASVCALVGCPGCLPRQAYNADDTRNPAYAGVASGAWTGASNPRPRPEGGTEDG